MLTRSVHSQIALFMDDARQSDNCKSWSAWGNCIWIKGPHRSRTGGVHPWNRNYFDQLSPVCQRNFFYSKIHQDYGEAINNAVEYFRSITVNEQPCGMCSFKQSCGINCEKKNKGTYYNKIFVAEELCHPQDLNGYTQELACFADLSDYPQHMDECKIWPNKAVKLPRVPPKYKKMVSGMRFTNCIKAREMSGKQICRCCCTPFEPDPKDWKCKHRDENGVLKSIYSA
ncbi:unnamed protein product [Soboliphyme baturini]|uniref:SPASM domain-containing protein n=1 Tax=Soboliphyme baturini TaxID=241478 RepID=A0A183IYE3_9BILA|nr:unnamed protein product [Soboliphyme baturini]